MQAVYRKQDIGKMANQLRLLQIANVLSYVIYLVVHFHAYFGLWPRDEEDYNPLTYITPAPFVFYTLSILTSILFGGLIIYQFFESAENTVVDGVKFHFIGITLFSSGALIAFSQGNTIIAFLFLLVLTLQVSYAYYNIRNEYPAENLADKIFIHAPFSVYHAWVIESLLISFFAAFIPDAVRGQEPAIWVRVVVAGALIFIEFTALSYIDVAGKGDIVGSLVLAYVLYGISVKQDYDGFRITAFWLSLVTLIYSFTPFLKGWIRGRRGESAPLLG
ncbi:hypothetical protein G9A89_003541 [Geosiphon pyriformis]|nr:hypothetical protein G9A89_003541 [Geosiphon pyriformis]